MTSDHQWPPTLPVAQDQHYRTIVDQAHEGIWTIDAEGRTTYVNRRMAELLGWTGEEMLGRLHTDFMFEEDRPHGDLQMDLRRIGDRQVWDQRYRRKDGTELWTLASCAPLYVAETFSGALGMFTDITERRNLERSLRESEARFRGTFENAAVGIAHVDLDGRCLRVNHTYCRLMGYSAEEIMALTYSEFTHPDDLAADVAQAERLRRGEIKTYSLEKRYRRKDGVYFWAELTVSMLRDELGQPLHYISIIQDISDRKAAVDALRVSQQKLLAASRAKDLFLATLSHELRTPLSPVLLMAGEAIADPTTPERFRATFQTIAEAVEQQTRLIDDLLDVTRITAGKLLLQKERLDLGHLVRAVANVLARDAQAKSVVLELHPPSTPLWVEADPSRLRQVLANVIGNAVKFTPAQGRIDIRLDRDPTRAEAVLEVVDTGIGLSAEELPRLFEHFSQGDHASQVPTKYGGLGLGLLISRNLVEQQGGSLAARSEGRGRGATFTIRLPLCA